MISDKRHAQAVVDRERQLPKKYRTRYCVNINVSAELPELHKDTYPIASEELLEVLSAHAYTRVQAEMAPWLHPCDIVRRLTRVSDRSLFCVDTFSDSDVWRVRLTALPIGMRYTPRPMPRNEEWAGFDFVDWLEARDQNAAEFSDLSEMTQLLHWAAYKQDIGHQVGLVGIRATQLFDVHLDVARSGEPYVDASWLPVYGAPW